MFTELGVPTTFLLTSFYWDNMIDFGMNPKPGPDGVLAITMPMGDTKLGAEDLGKCSSSIATSPARFLVCASSTSREH